MVEESEVQARESLRAEVAAENTGCPITFQLTL